MASLLTKSTSVSPVKGQATGGTSRTKNNLTSSVSFVQNGGNMEQMIKDQDKILAMLQSQFGPDLVAQVQASTSFKIEEESLNCPELDDNPIFRNLRNKLRHFYFLQEEYRVKGLNQQHQASLHKSGVDFTFKI